MSVPGPKKDIKSLAQPLLDAIAPDCATNLLELAANREARQVDPRVAVVTPMGWQNNFFETKIRSALDIDALTLNGAWDDNVTKATQVIDIFEYICNVNNPPPTELTQTIKSLLDKAPEYIQELHVSVQSQFDDPNKLDNDPFKAFVAYGRMVHIVLSFNAITLLDQFTAKDYAQLNQYLMAKGYEATSQQLKETLQEYILSQCSFSTQDRIHFRLLKAANNHQRLNGFFENTDHSQYYGGRAFDAKDQNIELALKGLNRYPATLWQGFSSLYRTSKSIAAKAALFPLVKIQQCRRFAHEWLGLQLLSVQASYQEVPIVGSAISILKRFSPYMDVAGLGAYELYQLLMADEKSRGTLLNALSPMAAYLAMGALVIATGYAAINDTSKVASAVVGAVRRHHLLGDDMIKVIVEENMADFTAWLSQEKVDELGLKIFEEAIVLPLEVTAILSQHQQDKVYKEIARLRWQLSRQFFPQFGTPEIFVIPDSVEQQVGQVLYLPSRGPRRAGEQDLCEALMNLKLEASRAPHPPRFN